MERTMAVERPSRLVRRWSPPPPAGTPASTGSCCDAGSIVHDFPDALKRSVDPDHCGLVAWEPTPLTRRGAPAPSVATSQTSLLSPLVASIFRLTVYATQ